MLWRSSKNITIARPFGRAGWWASGPLLSASLTWLSGIPVVWQDLPTLLRLGSGLTDPSSKLCFRHKYHFHHCMVTPAPDQRKHRHHMRQTAVLKIPTKPCHFVRTASRKNPWMHHFEYPAKLRRWGFHVAKVHQNISVWRVLVDMTTFIDNHKVGETSVTSKPWVFLTYHVS